MEIYPIARPSRLSAAACALVPASQRPRHESLVSVVAERAQRPQVHQVQVQGPRVLALAAAGGNYGTNGFRGSKGTAVAKRMTDGASGVPPRGRPV